MSPARVSRRRLARPAWSTLVVALWLLSGCPSQPTGQGGRGPLDPGAAGSLAHIDVRHLDQRPRLALIARDGDPTPELVVAVLAQAGPIWHTALAAMLEHRLEAAGHAVETRADALGLRLHYRPADADSVAAFLAAVARAASAPIGPQSEALPLVRDRLAALRRRPLDGPAQVPIAACGGRLGIVATEPVPELTTAPDVAALDEARRHALVLERLSIAVVGSASLTETVVAALQDSGGWPHGSAATAQWPGDSHHGAYLSAELTVPGSARLDIAIRTTNALSAVGVAKRASHPASPLRLKLAATAPGWRLRELNAVAHSHGGCVTVQLTAGDSAAAAIPVQSSAAPPAATDPEAAAQVAALVAAEVDGALAEPTLPFDVTAEIIGAATTEDAAARAAWWAITGNEAAPSEPLVASAFAVSAHGKEPVALSGADLDARYRTAMAQQPERSIAGAIADRRWAVERGQGELWLLVASPCALSVEGSWDGGRAALAALAIAARQDDQLNVSIEPWVSADGVGLVAHSGLLRADESPADLAHRVATAAGRALLGLAIEEPAFGQAKHGLLTMLARDGAAGYGAFAARALPDHPAWLAPWGTTDRQLGVTAADVRERWRGLLSSPLRVAVLANGDEAQAELAARRLDRWLLPEARHRPCTELPRPAPGQAGRYRIAASPYPLGQVVVGTTLLSNTDGDTQLARQLVAALDGPDGVLRRRLPDLPLVAARLLGGARARAVVVDVRAPRGQLKAARTRVTQLLAELAAGGLDGTDRARGHERARAAWLERHRHPTGRLATLWRGEPLVMGTIAEPTEEQWRTWLAKTLRADRLIVVTEEQDGH